MAIVWMIRHGQASFGSDNYDKLSDLGAVQARMLGQWLAERGLRPQRIMHGTLERQRETAVALAEGLGGETPEFEIHAGLNEVDADDVLKAWLAEGNPHPPAGDRKAHFKALTAAVLRWHKGELAGAETYAQFAARVADALRVAAEGERPVFCVSSGGTIGQAVTQIMGAPAEQQIRLQMQVRNSSFTRFAGRAERLNMLSFNEIPHLEGREDLITWS